MKNTPRVRFKGFNEEWKEDFLNNLSHFSKGYGYSKSDLKEIGTPIILYGRLYTNYQTTIDTVNTYAIANSNSVYSKGNEVLIPSSGETSEDIARASAILQAKVLLGGDLNIITPTDKLNSIFLAFLITYEKPHKELSRLAQGKSVVHLHNSDLQKIEIQYPETKEQKKIGNFFKNIDTLIAKNQQKHEKLTQIKKSLLEKIFPKAGAKEPEIRFQGFSGEWEHSEIKDITKATYGGGTPKTSEQSYWNGTIPWIQSSDIREHDILNVLPQKTVSTLGVSKSATKVIPRNSIAVVTRVGVGKLAYIKFSYATSQDFLSLSNIAIDDLFCTYTIYKNLQNELNTVQGTSIKGITKEELLSKKIIIPKMETEQNKIGELFRLLDKRIALQQEKIEKLKNMKRAFLEKMFV